MKTLKVLWSIVSSLLLAVIILLFLITLSSNGNFVRGYKTFLIQSGSMEPSIMTGDIVIVQENSNYMMGEVVTFINKEGRTVTHRIAGTTGADSSTQFKTKGDANRSSDEDTVSLNNILGKVIFVVPKIGFLVAFTKTIPGFIVLIIFPALFIISSELVKIFRNV